MKNIWSLVSLLTLSLVCLVALEAQTERVPTASELIKAMDANLTAKTSIVTSRMVVHGRRSSRTITSKSWVEGTDKAFTEYLAPPREAGTKMLKLGDQLWTYSPQTDRIIQISGHMLRQSLMREELFAKSGKLLKSSYAEEVMQVEGRWYPKVWVFKDELKKSSKGTEWIIDEITFNAPIPGSLFSKAALRK